MQRVVAGILLLGVLALLIGYLLIGQACRDKLRRGTPWTALSFPGALVLTVVFSIAGEELEGPARTALVVGCVFALGLFVAYRRRRLEVDPPPPPSPPLSRSCRMSTASATAAGASPAGGSQW